MPDQPSSSSKRVALVTGASRGIGRACAERLAAAGCAVAVHYRSRAADAEAAASAIAKAGSSAKLFAADLSQPGAAEQLVAGVAEGLGPPSVLVHAAGELVEKPVAFTAPDEWARLRDLHAVAAFALAKALCRHLRKAPEGSGRIVLVGSLAGVSGLGNAAAYAATKGALHGLAKSLALEVARWGATANVVAPGYVETEMASHHEGERKTSTAERIPLGRYGCAEEIAAMVAFLASADAGYVTGQVLAADGGLGLG
ncbi:MAG: SDR family oxidoreductase [Planctomycetes bacterium]|nr:SDR family oxidoreductase [Planctomycetota bacterium]